MPCDQEPRAKSQGAPRSPASSAKEALRSWASMAKAPGQEAARLPASAIGLRPLAFGLRASAFLPLGPPAGQVPVGPGPAPPGSFWPLVIDPWPSVLDPRPLALGLRPSVFGPGKPSNPALKVDICRAQLLLRPEREKWRRAQSILIEP
mmetsp:Transcript_33075/g.72010  ORF Transcript_33075/g.72010 Transcript_33075/m.72010 type:complete len:149 (-) Transcript_33075:1842-2288(-)